MLKKHGFLFDGADHTDSAKHLLSHCNHDVVITDLQMPGTNGYALAGWIKDSFKDTTVIIMTGSPLFDVNRYIQSGIVDGWLFKLFCLRELCRVLREFI